MIQPIKEINELLKGEESAEVYFDEKDIKSLNFLIEDYERLKRFEEIYEKLYK